jgi:hypothetical protein
VNFNAAVTGSNLGWNNREITQTATTSTGLAGDESIVDRREYLQVRLCGGHISCLRF